MDKSEFSERLFETLVNHEILNQLKSDIYIPSQTNEAHLGLDALFQGKKRKILALQYKVVNKYKRVPFYFKTPAFKFDLHKDKKGYTQHNQLVEKTKRGLNAFYVIPTFITYEDLYNKYHLGDLLDNLYFILPTKKIKDNEYHYINFDTNCTAYMHSHEKISIRVNTFSDLRQLFEQSDYLSKESFIQLFFDDEIVNQDKDQYINLQQDQQIISFLRENNIILFAL